WPRRGDDSGAAQSPRSRAVPRRIPRARPRYVRGALAALPEAVRDREPEDRRAARSPYRRRGLAELLPDRAPFPSRTPLGLRPQPLSRRAPGASVRRRGDAMTDAPRKVSDRTPARMPLGIG